MKLLELFYIFISFLMIVIVIAIGISVWEDSANTFTTSCNELYGQGLWKINESVRGMNIVYSCIYNGTNIEVTKPRTTK